MCVCVCAFSQHLAFMAQQPQALSDGVAAVKRAVQGQIPSPSPAPAPQPPPPLGTVGEVNGTVKKWNTEKGWGFISPEVILPEDGGRDVYCHCSHIIDGDALAVGSRVRFVRELNGRRGQCEARQVTGGYSGGGGKPTRFQLGDRVQCKMVEGGTRLWLAGIVEAIDVLDPTDGKQHKYQVKLDDGTHAFAPKDCQPIRSIGGVQGKPIGDRYGLYE